MLVGMKDLWKALDEIYLIYKFHILLVTFKCILFRSVVSQSVVDFGQAGCLKNDHTLPVES